MEATRRGFIGALLGLPLLSRAAWRMPWVRTPDNLLTPAQVIERANADGRSYTLRLTAQEMQAERVVVTFRGQPLRYDVYHPGVRS